MRKFYCYKAVKILMNTDISSRINVTECLDGRFLLEMETRRKTRYTDTVRKDGNAPGGGQLKFLGFLINVPLNSTHVYRLLVFAYLLVSVHPKLCLFLCSLAPS